MKRRHSIVRVLLATLAESVKNSWTCVTAVTVVMVVFVYLSMTFHHTRAIARMVSRLYTVYINPSHPSVVRDSIVNIFISIT